MIDLQAKNRFVSINLKDLVEQIGEDATKGILSSFECPINKDVEIFIRDKAIEFTKHGISSTHLVFWESFSEFFGESRELVGYYTLATKSIILFRDLLSKNMWSKATKFANNEVIDGKCTISAILIGQLGKNFANGNDTLIKGNELLGLAIDKVRSIQREAGGKFTYLECEDKEFLLNFYQNNGFIKFGKRKLDMDETDLSGDYLIQFLRYLH